MVAGTTSAVNLTDGLDGLAAGSAAIVLLAYIAITFTTGRTTSRFAACLLGACSASSGSTRSRRRSSSGTRIAGLGGAIAALAVMTETESC